MIFHTNGIPWHEAPLPRRFHRCWIQTYGMVGGIIVSRCPCGAISYDLYDWMERNSRRKSLLSRALERIGRLIDKTPDDPPWWFPPLSIAIALLVSLGLLGVLFWIVVSQLI